MSKEDHFEEDSIDLIEIFKSIYKERKLLIKVVIASFALGIIVALFSSNQYTSNSTFIPQINDESKPNSSLSGLASLAGINLNQSSGSELSPLLYPEILNSNPYRLDLLSSKILYESESISIRDFILLQNNFFGLIKKYTIGLPGLIISALKSDDTTNNEFDLNIYKISEEDYNLFKSLDDLLNISINEDEGLITLSSTDSNIIIPAQIVRNAEEILQQKIIELRVKSSQEFLNFSENQFKNKTNELNKLLDRIAIFRDQNLNINSSLYQNKLDRLLSEAQILQTVVQQLASQVEQAKLQVSKDTPVFTVIKPVSIPFKKSAPSRTLIVIIFVFMGLIGSIGFILLKSPASEIWSEINS
jgi:hypothetical protein